MKKAVLIIMSILTISAYAQTTNPDHQWFTDARFGLFVHFGPSSILGDGEWVMNNRSIKVKDYKRLGWFFDPRSFDAKAWVRMTKEAGMKYITFTTRHHDSFSNWDTKQSDWNIMNTPYGRDLLKELADECHRENIKLVLYYSLLDWTRDDYQYKTGNTGKGTGRTQTGDWLSYIAFMKAQLTELLTNYGDIAGIWFDGEWDQHPTDSKSHANSHVDWHYPEIYSLIHTLQPNCMISNNHHMEVLPGEDYQAFEKDLPGENTTGFSPAQIISKGLPLEMCETMNNAWGYSITDTNYKSTKQLIDLLVRSAGHGANFLLNVGPMPNGQVQPEFVERLQEIGAWMDVHGKTIYGTQGGYIKPQSWGAVTQKGNTMYVHILNKESDTLSLQIPSKVKSAKWLEGGAKLRWKTDKKTGETVFDLSTTTPNIPDAIIEIIVE